MTSRIPSFKVEHNGVTYVAEVARVDYFSIGDEDHGLFSFALGFESGAFHQALPARALDTYDETLKRRVGTAFGMDLLMAFVHAIGSPEQAKGRGVVVLRKHDFDFIEGFARLNDDGTFGDLVIPQEIADRHYPKQATS